LHIRIDFARKGIYGLQKPTVLIC